MGTICSSSKTTGHIPLVTLPQKQLEELNESTNIPEGEILMYYRQFIRASPTGRMTHSQFENQLKTMGAPTDGSEAIFKMIDKDNSGQISFQEYLLSIVMFSQQSQPEQQLGVVFDTYQALSRQSLKQPLNDYQIKGMTRNDIEHMLKQMHPDLSKEEIEELCDRYMDGDQNKNGFISKQEFITACMKNPKLMEQLGHKDHIIKEDINENEISL
jgi:Ca2+-binding EF-hand superfamily protein